MRAHLFRASLTCELLREGLMVPLPSQLLQVTVPEPLHLRQVVCPLSNRDAACPACKWSGDGPEASSQAAGWCPTHPKEQMADGALEVL